MSTTFAYEFIEAVDFIERLVAMAPRALPAMQSQCPGSLSVLRG
jgi:hypothetical protein